MMMKHGVSKVEAESLKSDMTMSGLQRMALRRPLERVDMESGGVHGRQTLRTGSSSASHLRKDDTGCIRAIPSALASQQWPLDASLASNIRPVGKLGRKACQCMKKPCEQCSSTESILTDLFQQDHSISQVAVFTSLIALNEQDLTKISTSDFEEDPHRSAKCYGWTAELRPAGLLLEKAQTPPPNDVYDNARELVWIQRVSRSAGSNARLCPVNVRNPPLGSTLIPYALREGLAEDQAHQTRVCISPTQSDELPLSSAQTSHKSTKLAVVLPISVPNPHVQNSMPINETPEALAIDAPLREVVSLNMLFLSTSPP